MLNYYNVDIEKNCGNIFVGHAMGGLNIPATYWVNTNFSSHFSHGCIFLDKLFNFSDLQFAHPQNEGIEQGGLKFLPEIQC